MAQAGLGSAQTEMERVAALQEMILNMSNENIDEVAHNLACSVFAATLGELEHLVSIVVALCQYRFDNVTMFAELITRMKKFASPENAIRDLHKAILYPFVSTRATHPTRMIFIAECLRLGALTDEELVTEIRKFDEWWPYDDFPKVFLLIWHHKSVKALDKEMYESLIEVGDRSIRKANFGSDLVAVFESIKNGEGPDALPPPYPPESIVSVLLNDDDETLESRIRSGEVSVNDGLELGEFQVCDLLRSWPNLLRFCACHGCVKCFKCLIRNGAICENIGECVVCGGSREIAEMLFKDNPGSMRGCLQGCALFFRFDLFLWIKQLEIKGISYNIHVNDEFGSVFHMAAMANNIRFLLYCVNDKSFDVNMRAIEPSIAGYTPLHCAAEHGRIDAVKTLLSVDGIDVNAKGDDEMTPLLRAAYTGQVHVVKLLSEHPSVDMRATEKQGRNALFLAVENGMFGVAKFLLSTDFIDPNSGDNANMTPLHWAAQCDNYGMCKMLLDSGKVNVNCQDHDGLTALHWAVRHGNVNVMNLLLSHPDENPNLLDNIGWSALIWGIECGKKEAISILLKDPKVDVNVRTNGRVALAAAVEKDDKEIIALLLKSMPVDTYVKGQVTPA